MDFGSIAAHFTTDPLEVWDRAVQQWRRDRVHGTIKRVDRFLSMFDRPTHRRQLVTAADRELKPDQNIIRSPSTGDIYLVGERQRDFKFGRHYATVYPAHLAAGVAAVVRKAPAGPPEDPGPLVETIAEQTWAAAEMRAEANDSTSYVGFVYGNFFMFFAPGTDLRDRDFVDLGGRRYFVEEVYADSGLLAARATDRPDDRVTATYGKRTGGPTYSTTTGAVTHAATEYEVTVCLSKRAVADERQSVILDDEVTISIEGAHVGVVPEINDYVVVGGRSLTVMRVARDPLSLEWQLKCR